MSVRDAVVVVVVGVVIAELYVDLVRRARLPVGCSHTRSVMKLPYTSPEMLYFLMFVHERDPGYFPDSYPELVFYCTLATRTSDVRDDLTKWYAQVVGYGRRCRSLWAWMDFG